VSNFLVSYAVLDFSYKLLEGVPIG